ncbi:tRNA (cytosine38-C5)-methyltransferase [Marchantia polymorpha subsp. ruderalis]|uniref:Uncharacterized protein n=2 Tax=Marchantia polymorpha TaxID=3197 RepID=A0A176VQ58_MARPO|nr:hypothetical protein AXG93_1175s1040 [Marchantia polymorpha subsp. ruderalis]PTQ46526.1 hypothetical protein MARPO_0011s0185 [Marchantia polymorpha]BBN08492.1 hypothetical protein Mp_4g12030 [Marchantia polymorpha subsp. ruderalis]|eukprot:PTQ46526.1 hypothetical protein MARPO_0011s0185 [Marchantia polymorpha]
METTTLRVLEFYSGIGGLRYSLEDSGVNAVVVEAFDINDVGNDVYQHNFGHRPNQGNIQGLSVKQLDKYKADAWLLSPPCQPYTRQGLQKDADDARAISFLKMLEMLPLMMSPPSYLLVENVVGFENSVTHSRLLAVLKEAEFTTQEFILTPLQFGIPYSRPRYFCLAKRNTLPFLDPTYNGQLLCEPGPLLQCQGYQHSPALNVEKGNKSVEKGNKSVRLAVLEEKSNALSNRNDEQKAMRNEPILDPAVICRPVRDFLETVPSASEESQSKSSAITEVTLSEQDSGKRVRLDPGCPAQIRSLEIAELLTSDGRENSGICKEDQFHTYRVPTNVVQRWIDAYDIVTPDSRRCCCFTKSYTRYAKGTGSFLAMTVNIKEGTETSVAKHIANMRAEGQPLDVLDLRYFTPREVANLHSFPQNFRFPVHVKLKQRYALLGNSLSVAVVSGLLKYLFSSAAKTERTVS